MPRANPLFQRKQGAEEEDKSLGGLRHPYKANVGNPHVKLVGLKLRKVIFELLELPGSQLVSRCMEAIGNEDVKAGPSDA